MSITYAPTLEIISYLNSIVPSWLGVIGTRARWIFKRFCLWDNNKLQTNGRSSWEYFVNSWTRSFTVGVTESCPKTTDYSIPSLETDKIMMLYCRLEVYKIRMEIKFWLTVSTNGESTRLCHKWNNFCLFGFTFWCAWLREVEKLIQKWRLISFFIVATRFFCKPMCTITTKQHNCRFWTLKGRISLREQAFHFLQS